MDLLIVFCCHCPQVAWPPGFAAIVRKWPLGFWQQVSVTLDQTPRYPIKPLPDRSSPHPLIVQLSGQANAVSMVSLSTQLSHRSNYHDHSELPCDVYARPVYLKDMT